MSDSVQQSLDTEYQGETSPTISFQDGVTNLLIQTEELRRNLNALASSIPTNEDCFRVFHDVDGLMGRLYSPPLAIDVSNSNANGIEVEMRNQCLHLYMSTKLLDQQYDYSSKSMHSYAENHGWYSLVVQRLTHLPYNQIVIGKVVV